MAAIRAMPSTPTVRSREVVVPAIATLPTIRTAIASPKSAAASAAIPSRSLDVPARRRASAQKPIAAAIPASEVVAQGHEEDRDVGDVKGHRDDALDGHRSDRKAIRQDGAALSGLRVEAALADDGEEDRDQLRVELPARLPPKLGDGLVRRSRGSIGSGMDHRVECVDDADDPSPDRDGLAPEAVWVAAAVPALAVVAYDRRDEGAHRQRLADPLADERMAAHLDPLGAGEGRRLREDRVVDPDLADVVEESPERDRAEGRGLQPERGADPVRERGQTLAVLLRERVLGLDRVRERGDDTVSAIDLGHRFGEAQDAPDTRHELGLVVGLRQEVVGPGVETGNDVLEAAAAREQDDGQRHGPGVGAEGAADIEAIHAGQLNVEDDKAGRFVERGSEGIFAGRDRRRLVATAGQERGQERAIRGVILNHQNTRPQPAVGHRDASPGQWCQLAPSLLGGDPGRKAYEGPAVSGGGDGRSGGVWWR